MFISHSDEESFDFDFRLITARKFSHIFFLRQPSTVSKTIGSSLLIINYRQIGSILHSLDIYHVIKKNSFIYVEFTRLSNRGKDLVAVSYERAQR